MDYLRENLKEFFDLAQTDKELEQRLIELARVAITNNTNIYDELTKILKRHYEEE